MTTLNNQSPNTFTDISTELFRTYRFPNDELVTIQKPTHLSVSASGHRLLDADGISHYVPKGWIHLIWKAKDGQPNFVK